MTETFDFEHPPDGLDADGAQRRQIVQALADAKYFWSRVALWT